MKEEKRKRNHHQQENVKMAWNIEKTGAMTTLIQKGSVRKAEGRTVFHFDQAFDEDVQTPIVYKSIARPMVKSVLNGKHATIFAYGQTGSGKTFTMQGDGQKVGIIQLVTSDLFRYMRKGEAKKREFGIKVSYFEIYNEKIRDLLSDDIVGNTSSSSSSPVINRKNREKEIKIRTNEHGEIVVNVIQKKVSNVDEAIELLIEGKSHRTVAATDMNEYSSRSHTVFRITVESRSRDIMNEQQQLPVESQGQEIVRISDFNLVDLAGSESLKSTNNTGTRQREGATINKR
jgi:centromeric protein E